MTLSRNSNLLAAGFEEGTIRLWNIPTFDEVAHHTHHAEYAQVAGVAWDKSGQILFSTSADAYQVLVWESGLQQTPRIIYQGPDSDDDAEAHYVWDSFEPGILKMDPTGQFLACGDSHGRIKIWNTTTYELYTEIKAHTSHVLDLAFDANGTRFVSGSYDGTLGFWKINGKGSTIAANHLDQVRGVAWSPNGKYILCAGYGPSNVQRLNEPWPIIQEWDPWAMRSTHSYKCPTPWGDSIAFHPSYSFVAVGHSNNTITIWNPESWVLLDELKSTARTVAYLEWTSNGLYLVSGGYGVDKHTNGIDIWALDV